MKRIGECLVILTLKIEKMDRGIYRAAWLAGGQEVAQPEVYDSIEDALREEARAMAPETGCFAEVHYSGASTGTMMVGEIAAQASAIAHRLVEIVGRMHEAERQRS